VIRLLPAGALVEFPQLLLRFNIAVFRCCPQQNPRLFAILRDALAREVKLCKRNLCRTIACPYRTPELLCKGASAFRRMWIR
jgi:hypothetical protein